MKVRKKGEENKMQVNKEERKEADKELKRIAFSKLEDIEEEVLNERE